MIAHTIVTIVVDKQINEGGLDTVLIKVASRCNINCTYCYVYNMGDDNWKRLEKLISIETVDAICQSLSEVACNQKKYFSVVLHGGEPFLLGQNKLKYLLSQLRKVLSDKYPISIQTNGILVSNSILDICSEFKVSVAVSIDGPEHIHNKFRITPQEHGTFQSVMKGIKLLQSHSDSSFLNAGLLAVIDPLSNPSEVYHFFKSLSTPSVDFLYKDGNHNKLPLNKSSINSIEYGEWMVGLFTEYINDPKPIIIRVLDDMLKVLLGGIVTKEGLGITNFSIVIIDTDGTIMKNDTLKSSYNGADKFERPYNIKDSSLKDFLLSEEFELYREMQRPSNSQCLNCPDLHICGGGMILHRYSEHTGFNNPSVYCADQIHLIKNLRLALSKFSLLYV